LAGFDAAANQFVQNSLAPHNIAKPLDTLFVGEICPAGKLLNLGSQYPVAVGFPGDRPFIISSFQR
jgi:hypothetical protein